jgi:hypothetical protein
MRHSLAERDTASRTTMPDIVLVDIAVSLPSKEARNSHETLNRQFADTLNDGQ